MSEITQLSHPSALYSRDENGNSQRKRKPSTTSASNSVNFILMDQQGRNDVTSPSPNASADAMNDCDHEESASNEQELSSESSVGTGFDESVELEQGSDELASSAPNETGTSVVLPENRKRSKAVKTKFPIRLFEMVEDAARKDFEHIVSWTLGGRGCKVHNEKAFATKILPDYFTHSKIRSFHRQLSYWGFERILIGADKNAYAHPGFVRGHPEFVQSIRRVANKGSAKRKHGVSINLRQAGEIEMDNVCLSLDTKTTTKNQSKKKTSSPSKPRPIKSVGVMYPSQHSDAPLRPGKKKNVDRPITERPRVTMEIHEPGCGGVVDFGKAETAQHGNENSFNSCARIEFYGNWSNHFPTPSTTVHVAMPQATIFTPSYSATFPPPLRRNGEHEGEAGQNVLLDPFFLNGTTTHCPSATTVDPGATNTHHHRKTMATTLYGDVDDVQKNLFDGIIECRPIDQKNIFDGIMEGPQIDKATLRQKLRSIYAALADAECQVIALKELHRAACCSPSASSFKEAKVELDHNHHQEPREQQPNYFSPQDAAQDNLAVFDLKTMDRLAYHEDDASGYGSVASSGDRRHDEPRALDPVGDVVDIVEAN